MKQILPFILLICAAFFVGAQSVPELIYYKFDGTGTSVDNLASSPVGNNPATIVGGLSQGGTGQFGGALQGNGSSSASNYVNTGWGSSLSGDWTMSFYTGGYPSSTTLYYILGDNTASSWRCFTNGVAGANNLMLRGPVTDVLVTNCATSAPHVVHFVHDATAGEIRAYVDGVLNNTVSQGSININGSGPFKVGAYSGSTNLANGAYMDEFRLYNRALDITEIQSTWNQTLPLSMAANDAGVSKIDSPTVFCEGTKDIVVTVQNYGINQIDTVTVNWMFNGVLQTPVIYTGSVLDTLFGTGSNTAQVFLGTKTFVSGQKDSIAAWTSMPNNVVDTSSSNDSTGRAVQPSVSGTFTIDAGGGGDFTNFNDAIVDIIDFGVCGPVVFNVVTGSYNEQVSIGQIEGASAANTITFQPDANNTGAVEVEYSGSSSGNYVFELSGASWVTIDGFEIEALSSSYGSTIRMDNGASNNTIKNNVLTSPSASTSTNGANIYWLDANNDNNMIMDNVIDGGSYGIYASGGNTTARGAGTVIENNEVSDYYYMGIYVRYQDDPMVHHNMVTTSNNYAFGFGIYGYYNYNNARFTNNLVNHPIGRYGMYFFQQNGTANARPLVANNMIHAGDGTNSAYGLYFDGGFGDVVHNSVVKEVGATNLYYGLYLRGGANSVKNNMVVSDGGSSNYYAYYISGSFAVLESNYNNIYVNGNNQFGFFGAAYSDLAAWQTGTGFDTNSTSIDPGYTNYDSLRTCKDSLDGTGTPLGELVIDDFDGDARSTTAPDVGADEWIGSAPGSYSAGEDQIVCAGKTVDIGTQSSAGSFNWSTGDTTSVITVNTAGTYTVSMTTECGSSHMDTVEVVDRTPVANFTTDISFQSALFTNNSQQGDSYLWVFGDGDSSTTMSPTHIYPDNGPYTACLYVYNDCDTAEFCSEISFWVGIDNPELASEISIYPNPAKDVVFVEIGDLDSQTLRLEVMDIQGKQYLTQRIANLSGSTVESIDVSSLAKGVYILRLTSDSETLNRRLIIE